MLETKVKEVSSNINELHEVIIKLFKELLGAVKTIENLRNSNCFDKYMFYVCLLIACQGVNMILGTNMMINAHVIAYFMLENYAVQYVNAPLYRMLCVVNITF